MEHLDGRNLKELLQARGPAPVKIAIEYVRQILAALRFAHRNGIVHRDIKPHNVLVDAEGRIKVTDFGIARAGGAQMTEVGSIVGTAQYLSPEQARGAPVDQRSDVYSLGVVLYELLTGTVPFSGDAPVEIAMKHLSEVPQPPSERKPGHPARARPRRHARDRQGPGGALPGRRRDGPRPRARGRRRQRQPRDRGGGDLRDERERRDGDHEHAGSAPHRPDPGVHASAGRAAAGGLRLRGPSPAALAVAVGARAPLARRRARRRGARLRPDPGAAERQQAGLPSRSSRASRRTSPSSGSRTTGLRWSIVYANDDNVPVGYVIEQRPRPGEKSERGNVVDLTVSLGKKLIEIPDMRGRSSTDAVADLTRLGLEPRTVQVPSDRPTGTVVAQSPAPGTKVREETRVRLNVSSGPQLVLVPNVVGQPYDSAAETLQQAGFAVAREDVDSNAAPGIVVTQLPAANSSVARRSRVRLEVSRGPETILVPDVVNADRAGAVATLESAGFEVREVVESTTDETLDDRVLGQSPRGGTREGPGSTVTITIGRYEPPQEPDQPDDGVDVPLPLP